MASENFKKALKILSKRKQEAQLDATFRKAELYEKIPRLKTLSTELSLTGVKLSKLIFSRQGNVEELLVLLKNENLRLQQEQAELLRANGYPMDYLETHYTCSKCEDSGYYNGLKCECLTNLITELNVSDFNQSTNMTMSTFDTFSLSYYSNTPDSAYGIVPSQQMKDILEFCKIYAKQFQKNSPSVLMMGETGLGKTHLSLSIAHEIMKQGYVALYSSALDLFRTLQNEYFGRGELNQNTMHTILTADLVIIDDLGAEFDSQFNTSSLYNIINSRLNVNKPTIINTNLSPVEIEKRYTSRVASRLMTLFKCLKFVGIDVRQIKLKNHEL